MTTRVAGVLGHTQRERSTTSAALLLRATIELIAEQGFEKTTAAQIGERAGYSREMVRHRYGSKEQLLEWVLEHEHKQLLLQPAQLGRGGLENAIAQITLMGNMAARDPERLLAFLVLCFEAVGPIQTLRPWMRAWFAAYSHQLAAAIRAGQHEHSIRTHLDADVEARDLTYYAVGLCFSFTLHRHTPDFVAAIERLEHRVRHQWQTRHTPRPS
jgi:AcrR family transcriptional regulator